MLLVESALQSGRLTELLGVDTHEYAARQLLAARFYDGIVVVYDSCHLVTQAVLELCKSLKILLCVIPVGLLVFVYVCSSGPLLLYHKIRSQIVIYSLCLVLIYGSCHVRVEHTHGYCHYKEHRYESLLLDRTCDLQE